MKQFSHIGIPSNVVREGETHLEEAKLYVTDFAASENKIEWLRFEDGSPMPEQLQTVAHVAFMVDDLDQALEGQEILLEPFEPMEGLKVAFILEDGAPVEFMQEM
ncbi:MAG: hypothetical protein KAU94_10460 [Verrucomicrobia bacterium]|nr:hypothetical protein [Verrucomicrobiota bacterium]